LKGTLCIRYLTRYGRQAALPYLFLIIATLSQLAVPRMIRNVIDAVTSGYVADQILAALDKIPANFIGAALPKILEAAGRDASLSLEQLKVQLEADISSAPQTLINALILIIVFAARSVRLFAGVLGGKELPGGGVRHPQ
jgi:ATP-binding cassette, subfamily B, multidrug efflux pump